MKNLLLMTIAALAVLFAVVGLAQANGGPHGGYTTTTDACAGCHRTHTAVGPKLLVQSSTYDLCQSCHGATASGANTNVEDGVFNSTRNPSVTEGAANTPNGNALLGGGFVNYQGAATTSNHDVSGTVGDAWGNGGARGTLTALANAAKLDCASCHNPHGSPNYRILEESINGAAVTVPQVDEGAKDYDTENWGAGMSNVCKACHSAYHVTRAGSGHDNADNGTGNTDYGGSVTSFAHRVDMAYNYGSNVNPETTGFVSGTTTLKLPLANDGTDDKVVCTTCHLPHGTSTHMAGFATGATAGPTGGSALLRLDNRGVCEVCHQK